MPSTLSALSPLDGRYAHKMGALRPILSELGYMQRRVQVEVAWLLALCEAGLAPIKHLSPAARAYLVGLARTFSHIDGESVKRIEQTTNHDVKAIEYWLKERMVSPELPSGLRTELSSVAEYVHVACTSEDINNTSHALQLKACRERVLLPTLDHVIDALRAMAHEHAETPMLARTHGQTATPTTMGKELANVVARLTGARTRLAEVRLMAKMNGAVGNFNAHQVAWPDVDWSALSRRVIETPEPADDASALDAYGLGLFYQAYTTQIEPHDAMAELFDATARTNTILIDLARDIWGYVSLGYFKQRTRAGEIGSSTMPHKVNPIDFENAEGNLGLANALLRHMSDKLPISRWQRDLSDSTVIRNMGSAFGYTVLAWESLRTGLAKLQLNQAALEADLLDAWEVIAEPIQTVMRRYGLAGAYEQLKDLTRGKNVTRDALHQLIRDLDIPDEARQSLLALTPATYTGLASELARRI